MVGVTASASLNVVQCGRSSWRCSPFNILNGGIYGVGLTGLAYGASVPRPGGLKLAAPSAAVFPPGLRVGGPTPVHIGPRPRLTRSRGLVVANGGI